MWRLFTPTASTFLGCCNRLAIALGQVFFSRAALVFGRPAPLRKGIAPSVADPNS
jgi:hypothetical protein